MSETSIKPIGSVAPLDPGLSSRTATTDPAGITTAYKPKASETGEAAKPMETDSNPSKQADSLSNVSIHFKLDDKTNELTVFVVDRTTRRVLRSIPASELHKLQAGDLLKLIA